MNERISRDDDVDRTVRRRLLSLLAPAMLFAFMTRTNVAFVAAGLERDFAVGPATFGLAAGIFFIGYLLFEVPSNLIMAKVGARLWLSRVMIGSGIASALMMFIEGRWSFVGLRFLLGVAEAGFLPGVTLYTGYWIASSQLPRFYAVLMSMVPLSYCITAIASGLLLLLDGQLGLAGWQWVFLIEALPAIMLGILLIAKLPDGVADAPWLTDQEKRELSARLTSASTEQVYRRKAGDFCRFDVFDFRLLRFGRHLHSIGVAGRRPYDRLFEGGERTGLAVDAPFEIRAAKIHPSEFGAQRVDFSYRSHPFSFDLLVERLRFVALGPNPRELDRHGRLLLVRLFAGAFGRFVHKRGN